MEVLKNEFLLLEKDYGKNGIMAPLVEKYKKRQKVIDAFQRQLIHFSQNVWPFDSASGDKNVSPYTWWKNLVLNPNADILAVCFFSFSLT